MELPQKSYREGERQHWLFASIIRSERTLCLGTGRRSWITVYSPCTMWLCATRSVLPSFDDVLHLYAVRPAQELVCNVGSACRDEYRQANGSDMNIWPDEETRVQFTRLQTEKNRLMLNKYQPSLVPKFTEVRGFYIEGYVHAASSPGIACLANQYMRCGDALEGTSRF